MFDLFLGLTGIVDVIIQTASAGNVDACLQQAFHGRERERVEDRARSCALYKGTEVVRCRYANSLVPLFRSRPRQGCVWHVTAAVLQTDSLSRLV